MAGIQSERRLPRLGLARAVPAVRGAGRSSAGTSATASPRARCSRPRSRPKRRRELPVDGRVPRAPARACCSAPACRVGENIVYYILTVFSLTFLVDVAAQSRSLALDALLIGAAVQFVAIPLLAMLSDRIGRRAGLCVRRASGSAIFVFLFFPMLASGSNALIILAIVVGLVLHASMYAPQAAFITELFPTRIRYSGVSIAYQLTAIFAGILAPIIALWLYKDLHSSVPVSIYVAIACAISGVSALLARETQGVELSEIR